MVRGTAESMHIMKERRVEKANRKYSDMQKAHILSHTLYFIRYMCCCIAPCILSRFFCYYLNVIQ